VQRVLVTGAAGFIGRPALPALHERGFEVHAVARSAPPEDADTGAEHWHCADLLDPDAAETLIDATRPSHLLHLAWCTAHGQFWSDPANLDWTGATLHLLRAFEAGGGARAVVAGSCTQYDWSGDAIGPSGRVVERTTPRGAQHLYGRSKESTIELLDTWAADAGMSFASGLVFFPFGPHEKVERLVPSVTRRLLAGEPAETTAGRQVRDFAHVQDTAGALAALLASEATGPVNIASGHGSSVSDVASTIARILGREDLLRIGALPMREGEAASVVGDVNRMQKEVGFMPTFDLESGLANTVEWWRSRS
jgi:nucleoside-diphosphate-sugar epimerase